MKMNKLITTAVVLAFIGVASVENASAADFNGGDLILAFRLNDAGSTGTSLEFDLGQASSFNFAVSNATVANVSAGLTAVYGSGWASASDLVYSIVGGTTGHLYLSNPGNSQPYAGTLGSSTNINKVSTLYGSPSGAVLESDGSYAIANSNTQSYADVLANVLGTEYNNDYNFVNTGGLGTTEQAIGSTTDVDYLHSPSTVVDEGTFEVNSSGVLSFTSPAAVPEPASYVLGGIAAVLFVIMHRRSKIQA